MNVLIYHVASGQAFFTGAALVILAGLASTRKKKVAMRLATWSCLLGLGAIGISATPLPYWYYALALLVTAAWLFGRGMKRWRRWTPWAVVAVWTIAAGMEMPYHFTPTPTPAPSRSLTIVGDSITAGMGGSDTAARWPALLARRHALDVQDISRMGATTASALKGVSEQPLTAPVVLLEIGGNDLLGGTSTAQFARDLDALLKHVCTPDRQVLLFELPLPPFHNGYGRIQRTLARKHGVALIPKRVLLSVLTAPGATLDTIHLSPAGHERMARRVWRIVSPAFVAPDS